MLVEEIIIPPEKREKYWMIYGKYYKIEHHKISTLLNNSTVSKFVTRKWIEVNDLSDDQYSVDKNIRFKTPMLRWDLRDHSDAYIAVKGAINLSVTGKNDVKQKDVIFKNNAPFKSCIWRSNIESARV